MLATSLLALAFFAFGGSARAQESGLPSGLIGPTWRLVEIQRSAQDVMSTAAVRITLTLDTQGLASGESTCNLYSAEYQAGQGGALTMSPVVSTLRACVDTSLMDLESEYYRALEGVTSYSFDGSTLQLFYNNGASVLRFTADAPAAPGMPRTGAADSNYGLPALAGMLLVLLGLAALVYDRVVRRGSGVQR
jgi:heat shock protein HslJ